MHAMPNVFEILGVPARFDLDEGQLLQRFIALSSQTHPDRFTDPVEQAEAAERAAAINEAYRVLKDPESRAEALLTVMGGADRSSDKSLPPDLLMDMMEVRERMESAIESSDRAALEELRTRATQTQREYLERIGSLFASAASDPGALKQIRLELNALRYIERMLEQMPA